VVCVGRRRLPLQHPKLEQLSGGAGAFEALAREAAAEDAFCCLGTTIAKAGSREAFRSVDHDAVLSLARGAKTGGARRLLLVSSSGADPGSRLFYSRVKGETERDAAGLRFEACHLLRPSLLLGRRQESRPLERLAQRLLPPLSVLLAGPLRRYRPIEARVVARAMVSLALSDHSGVRRWESDELQRLGS
jgi:uncharacterized protein YbjT (DUF2867 family)